MPYISEILTDPTVFEYGKLNLINAPCGAGKSQFVAMSLLSLFPDMQPCEVVFITSRAITVSQQLAMYPTLKPYDFDSMYDPMFWRGETRTILDNRICTMTFDKVIHAITRCAALGTMPFDGIKIIIIDECHALLTDTYIQSIEALIMLLRHELVEGKRLVIGMTATPQVLLRTPTRHGLITKCLCSDIEPQYKAAQLILTAWQNLPTLLTDPDYGQKTLVMVHTRNQAIELQRQIPNSGIIVSRHNDDWCNEDMLPVWLSLIHKKVPPEKCQLPLYDEERELIGHEYGQLRVLIMTTVAREGLNIIEESGIRNVVCCVPDDLHITQFLGRCRYCVDNLILCQAPCIPDSDEVPYLTEQHKAFAAFLNGTDNTFFKSIRHLVQHEVDDTIRYTQNKNLTAFQKYMEENWIVENPAEKYGLDKLLQKPQQKEIVRAATEQHIFDLLTPKPATKNFNALLPLLRDQIGYEFRYVRPTIDGKQRKGYILIPLPHKSDISG